jgi:peptidoglycan/LPS O-acetylase OafA/YrhL
LFLLQKNTPFHLERLTWIGNLTFTTNLVGSSSWTSGHLWSLALEEQFYLLWPTIFVFARGPERPGYVTLFLIAPIILCPVMRVLSYINAPLALIYNGLASSDSIAIGCAAALLFFHKRDGVERFLKGRLGLSAVIALVLVVVPYVLTKLLWLGILTVPLGQTCQALGFSALLLIGVMNPDLFFWRLLQAPILVGLGVLSYSIYIWQMIFCTNAATFGFTTHWWFSFPGWMAASVLVGFASYTILEKPFFSLRKHFRS